MVKPVKTSIPKSLEALGLSVKFGDDGSYICYDQDGCELKSFEQKWQALAYLRETFELEIEAQAVED